ncbi:thiamine kinase [Aquisphaera giovannonii]|uniref:Thiamine kinase n=1 Tax=Aquisphaera giovannonii TaxID=406548 RepID=A0A5B9WE96_9BACT|nr:choline/ethanolamine kinase family protein [Aquisphaera giovannonii]QEH38902.1 thiamine kinase [Aquisphaera giovannonii]
MTTSIDQVLDRIPAWSGRSPVATPLAGGLTNRIYRVDVAGASYVVRIPGEDTHLLAIDRGNELHNTRAAAETGISPRVVHHIPDLDVLVLEYIDAETMTAATMHRPGRPAQLAGALRRLHAGPRFRDDFDMFRITRRYLHICRERRIRIPDDYLDALPHVARIEAAFARRPLPTVPCHNDLLAANILDDGRRLWLIDFEYSGNNDPTFELGNTCQELGYDEPRIAELCASYFGEPQPEMLARMRLNMVLSDIGWTLWSAIQAAVSAIEFDFWSWVDERWDRARAAVDSADFARWLQTLEAAGAIESPRPSPVAGPSTRGDGIEAPRL